MENEVKYDFTDKNGMLEKLRAYTANPDDDNIRIKEIIRKNLLHCPELLYALNNQDLEGELFKENGELNTEGEWDRYFGDTSNIRPFLFFPDTQTETKNFVCYKSDFSSLPRYNQVEKYANLTFVILVQSNDAIDKATGIPRQDLIAGIIRECFNWSDMFTAKCKLVSDKESVTDDNYITRTMVFQMTLPDGLVKTKNGVTSYVNNKVNKGV